MSGQVADTKQKTKLESLRFAVESKEWLTSKPYKQKTKLLKIPKRPFIIVSLEGDKDLVHEVKGFLETVLDWKITEDQERYADWLEHAIEGDNARIHSNFFLIKKYNRKEVGV